MPTRIILIRHGETKLTLEDRFAGASNDPLSAEGRDQATNLGIRLSGVQIAAAYASPSTRTMETAQILCAPHGLHIIPTDALREINYGNWEGLTRDEVIERYSMNYQLWEEDPLLAAPEGGETGLSVIHRALPFIHEVVERHRHQTILVVSHKGTNRLLVSSLLGFDARGYRDRLDQSPASLTILDFMNEVRPRLKLFNDVSHYQSFPAREISERLSKWWRPTISR